MVERGIEPNQVSYSTVLHAHARAGAPKQAQVWLDRMTGAGIAPDAVTFNTVCSAHARVGERDRVVLGTARHEGRAGRSRRARRPAAARCRRRGLCARRRGSVPGRSTRRRGRHVARAAAVARGGGGLGGVPEER